MMLVELDLAGIAVDLENEVELIINWCLAMFSELVATSYDVVYTSLMRI